MNKKASKQKKISQQTDCNTNAKLQERNSEHRDIKIAYINAAGLIANTATGDRFWTQVYLILSNGGIQTQVRLTRALTML